ncbi:Protein of unknown function [Bacillus cereus]|nr:Protein of unknown function [Bacillus cereus]
MEEKVEELIDI